MYMLFSILERKIQKQIVSKLKLIHEAVNYSALMFENSATRVYVSVGAKRHEIAFEFYM